MPILGKKLFLAAQPTATPTCIAQAQEWVAGVWGVSDPAASPTPSANIIVNALELILDGFTSSDLQAVASGVVSAAIPYWKSIILTLSESI